MVMVAIAQWLLEDSEPALVLSTSLSRIVRVEPYVLSGQVAGPEPGGSRAGCEDQPQGDLTATLQRAGETRGIEGHRDPALIDADVVDPEREVLLLERDARVAGGRDDPAPVRVATMNRGLHEGVF